MKTIVFSDIHGCFNTFKALLDKTDYDYTEDTFIFLGDYIDRGLHSLETVEFIKNLQSVMGQERCVCLKGNHELMATEYGMFDLWMYNGGYRTVMEYDAEPSRGRKVLEWMENLPVVYQTGNYIFCHAGLTEPRLIDNTVSDLLWGRDWIDNEDNRPREKTVVFGHTPQIGTAYTTKTGDICIDSGGVFGGKLCALIIREDDQKEFIYEKLHKEDV